ncbi:leucine--tRNA ligase [Patescibacteria group bacterium]|nr:leucine--tRNA ligase [Patescibacteria group bacterium]
MEKYNHKDIEKKWQVRWKREKQFEVKEDSAKEKYYLLIEFPYPSGEGLHTGHIRSYTAFDVIARKRRAEGFNVLFPIGWDAFGLPTENYALKTGVHPKEVTKQNTDTYRRQLQSIGFSFDWSREINTTDPQYYKWTQWIFLQLFKKGLAYKATMPINWCIDCKTGLANEEVVDEVCERCGGPTEIQEKEQWMLEITKYADRLDSDLDKVDYWEPIKIQQRNWIGKSEGYEINFGIKGKDENIKIFTTRPDTLYGATYMVLSPEHPLIGTFKLEIENLEEVKTYIKNSKQRSDIERTAEGKEKTGVEIKGIKAINPANKEEIPVFIADYVLYHYGTGAIMAVPAHDERDFEFAKKFGLPVIEVISGGNIQKEAYLDEGKLINSGKFNKLQAQDAKKKIAEFVDGTMKITYKLRDWIFSRQRYWGEPIPIIHCNKCGIVPMPEEELPLELPDVEDYQPTDTGESPLANATKWVNTTCPKCSGSATRETDTMPSWAGSSWYYLRYTDPHNKNTLAGEDKLKYWGPVDWYNGGMEHTTLHLLYSRFWHKFLYDIGVVRTEEPYKKRTSHGLILAEGGEKMSKSKGNVVNPDDVIKNVGADTLRIYEMFMGPFEQPIAWSTDNMVGSLRFLEKVWRIYDKISADYSINTALEPLLHRTIQKVGSDIEDLKFNTAISALMIFTNELEKCEVVSQTAYIILIRLLAPFAPHITEELWEKLGYRNSVHLEAWPTYDHVKAREGSVTVVIQVNGRVRARLDFDSEPSEKDVKKQALDLPNVDKWIEKKVVKEVIYIKNKLINIVV